MTTMLGNRANHGAGARNAASQGTITPGTSTQVTIPTPSGGVVLSLSGAALVAEAQSFAAAVAKPSQFIDLSTGTTTTETGSGPTLYEVSAGGTVSVPTVSGAAHDVFVHASGAVTVNGSGHNDSVLAAAAKGVTYIDHGGTNVVAFATGNGTYQGDAATGAGGDTLFAGAGTDVLLTGAAATHIDSGTGNAFIVLNDTVAAGDIVYLNGVGAQNIVAAAGAHDTVVVAGQGGQAIYATGTKSSHVTVVISGSGGNSVSGGGTATSLTVFDGAGNTSVTGAQGALTLIASAAVSDTLTAGQGGATIFGSAGSSFTVGTTAGLTQGAVTFLAGGGNETLNGAAASGPLYLYASNTATAMSTGAGAVLTGGAGNDTLFSGTGSETLTGGGGTNTFIIEAPQDSVAAQILISDFGSGTNDVAGFSGYTPLQIQAALDGQTHVSGSFGSGVELTFNDGTSVIFAGISTLNGHLITA